MQLNEVVSSVSQEPESSSIKLYHALDLDYWSIRLNCSKDLRNLRYKCETKLSYERARAGLSNRIFRTWDIQISTLKAVLTVVYLEKNVSRL